MKEKEILKVDNLNISVKKKGGKIDLLRDISFNISRGQIVGLIGETGSGKTLTMLSIMGMLPKDVTVESGKIIFMGEDLINKSDYEMKKIKGYDISMIFQSQKSSLSPIYKISTQMKDIIRNQKKFLKRKQLKEYCLKLLNQVGFDDPRDVYNKYPFEISGGMFQRVMLAIAMAMSPKLLIADEPTTALDADIQSNMLQEIKKFQEERNNSLIVVTHDFSIINKICTDVIVMKDGKIVEKGKVKDILKAPKDVYTKQLIKLKQAYI